MSAYSRMPIAQSVLNDFRLAITYVATKGTRLERSRDVNLFAPVAATLPIYDGTSSNQIGSGTVYQFNTATRPVANLGQINTFESAASSIYHGMFVSLAKRWRSTPFRIVTTRFGSAPRPIR